MCDFHSILGIAIGENYELRHDSTNSHSDMAGSLENKPNRKPIIFEVECSAEKLAACSSVDDIKSSIIRNFGECPPPLVLKIVRHYQFVKEALVDGRHLCDGGYFSDTKKYSDVWCKAIALGVHVTMPAVFDGNLYVYGSAKLDAPELKEVGGNLYVSGSAKLDAPLLKTVN